MKGQGRLEVVAGFMHSSSPLFPHAEKQGKLDPLQKKEEKKKARKKAPRSQQPHSSTGMFGFKVKGRALQWKQCCFPCGEKMSFFTFSGVDTQRAAARFITHWLTEYGLNSRWQTGLTVWEMFDVFHQIIKARLNYKNHNRAEHRDREGDTDQSSFQYQRKQILFTPNILMLLGFLIWNYFLALCAIYGLDYDEQCNLSIHAATSKIRKQSTCSLWESCCLMWVMRLWWGSCSTENWQAFFSNRRETGNWTASPLKVWDLNSTQQDVWCNGCAGIRGKELKNTPCFLAMKACQRMWIEVTEGNDIVSNSHNKARMKEAEMMCQLLNVPLLQRLQLSVFPAWCGASAVRCFNKPASSKKRPKSGGNNGSRKSSPPLQYSSFKGGCH